MTTSVDLQDLERKVFRSFFQDGLWDILIGCYVLIFAVAPYLSTTSLGDFWSSVVFVPFWLLVWLLVRTAKKRIVTPRVGQVKFGPSRMAKVLKLSIILTVVFTISFVMGIFAFFNSDLSGWIYQVFLGMIILLAFGIGGYFLDFSRLFIYGILLTLAPIIGELLYRNLGASHHGYPVTFGISAGIMILTGAVLFIQFIRKYPGLPEGKVDDNT